MKIVTVLGTRLVLLFQSQLDHLGFVKSFVKSMQLPKLTRTKSPELRIGDVKNVSKFDLLKGYLKVPLTERAKEFSALFPKKIFTNKK